jgi:hypothetical protein
MALKGDTVKLERDVNGQKQYKTVQALNLNSRKARAAYEAAGWQPSAGKKKPVGVSEPGTEKPKKGRPAKETPAAVAGTAPEGVEPETEQPETETEE